MNSPNVIALAVLRTLVGFIFVVAAIAGLIEHAPCAALFAHWQLPYPPGYPEATVFVVAAVLLVCGALMMAGALVRPAALVLATFAVADMATAGRVDGGLHLIVPPVLFAILVFYAWRSGRFSAWSPTRRPGTQ